MFVIDASISLSEIQTFLNQRKQLMKDLSTQVCAVGEAVARDGWTALADFTRRFDGITKPPEPQAFQVTQAEYEAARDFISGDLLDAIQLAIGRIRTFHEKQLRRDWFLEEPGITTGQLFRPLERVGVYAPGGTAVLFSTLLMNVIPAQVAGCPSITVCSPPQRSTGGVDRMILATCQLLGIEHTQLWSLGGAQAIFAMAYDLPGFPKVDGVFGPGNAYVMEAKHQVQGEVRIESLPGNSEILIIADDSAEPAFVAADLLSQAEHAGGELAILVTTSKELLDQVASEVHKQLALLKRNEIAAQSLSTGGALILVKDLEQACEIANLVAPEHLEIQTVDPSALVAKIRHAGAIFLGRWSTEPIGDYTAGTNHVLPTGGTARFSSALSVDDFMKKISVVNLSREGLTKIGPAAMRLAEAEGLTAHQAAIQVRMGY
jgi:histidinol dehydrogenase